MDQTSFWTEVKIGTKADGKTLYSGELFTQLAKAMAIVEHARNLVLVAEDQAGRLGGRDPKRPHFGAVVVYQGDRIEELRKRVEAYDAHPG